MSDRMSRADRDLILLFYCLCLLTSLKPAGTFGTQKRQDNVLAMTAGTVGIHKRQENVLAMTAHDDSTQDAKIDTHDDTDSETWTDKSVVYLKSTLASGKKISTSLKKDAGDLRKKLRSHNKHTNNTSTEENKKSTKHLLQSLVTNPIDIATTFKKNQCTPLHFFPVTIKDEFRCLPCQCYFTKSRSIVASCNSSVDEINAVLPTNTQQLTISNSSQTVFQAKDFLRYHKLHNLSVSKNVELYTIAKSSLKISLLTVTSLDLSSNNITNIEDNSFTAFPNLLNLSLANNYIATISTLTFAGLDNLYCLNLSLNNILSLETGTFDHFTQLQVLDLSCNSLNMSFTPGVFAYLGNLQQLFLNGNLQNVTTNYPNKEIARLANLTSLSIDGISNDVILGPEIKTLTGLDTLNVGNLKRRGCQLTTIKRSFLKNVPYLKTIRFFKCPLTDVDVNVYRHVGLITQLEFISTYPYDIFKALNGLKGLQNSSLTSLSLVELIPERCPFICLYKKHAKYLMSTELQVIDLSYNRIAYMDIQFIRGLPKTLRKLVLCGNELVEPKLLTDKLSFLNNLELIDLGTDSDTVPSGGLSRTQSIGGISERHDNSEGRDVTYSYNTQLLEDLQFSAFEGKSNDGFMYDKNFSQDAPICSEQFGNDDSNRFIGATSIFHQTSLPPSLNHFKTAPPMLKCLLAHGFLEMNINDLFKSIITHQYKHLTFLDLSYNAIPSLTAHSYIPPWIQAVNYNGNYFKHMHHTHFYDRNSLTHLSLSNNVLGDLFANTNDKIFRRLSNLVYLDISRNMIFELHVDFFLGLHKLHTLIIRENKLRHINMNFSTTPKLEYLDLSKNSISSISKSSRDDLDVIGTSHGLYIDLTSNPLLCTCEGLEVLHWIWVSNIHFVSKDMLKCIGDDDNPEYVDNINDRVRNLQRQCAGKAPIIVLCVASLAVMCFLVVFGVMYRYRWQLRYIRNIALSRFIGYKPRETARTKYKFDVFIVYSDMSRQFVVGDCLQELEVKRGHKLCVDGRDFMPGTYEVSAIVSAIQNSRKTVLILSPDFYDEQFSEYCVKMALMEEIYKKRSILYLCVYRPLPDDEMSKSYDLLMIMKRNNYLEFPPETETSELVRRNFWDELSKKIGHSVTKVHSTQVATDPGTSTLNTSSYSRRN